MFIGIMFGGVSNESEVSVITGTMVYNVLRSCGQMPVVLYQTPQGEWLTGDSLGDIRGYKGKIEGDNVAYARGGIWAFRGKKPKKWIPLNVIINAMHGGVGEGGGVAGLCELTGIPLMGCGILGSSILLDKLATKWALGANDIPIADYFYARSLGDIPQLMAKLPFPVIVKPTHLGSSVGIAVARNEQELRQALTTAFTLDDGAIVEPYFAERKEINVAVYTRGGELICSPCEECFSSGELLSYGDKYEGSGKRVFPADIPPTMAETMQKTAQKVYTLLHLSGIVRIDFMVVQGNVILSEVNTTPGSLSQGLLSASYAEFGQLLIELCHEAQRQFSVKNARTIIPTGLLSSLPQKGVK